MEKDENEKQNRKEKIDLKGGGVVKKERELGTIEIVSFWMQTFIWHGVY